MIPHGVLRRHKVISFFWGGKGGYSATVMRRGGVVCILIGGGGVQRNCDEERWCGLHPQLTDDR